jgi:hypothetical protein
MPRKSLRPHLNQIRAWVREGRTDAWIGHQLDVSATELRQFRQRHGLAPDGEEAPGEIDLRDEIEAEIEAAATESEEADEEEGEAAEEAADSSGAARTDGGRAESAATDEDAGETRPRRRGRRRRGRRGRGRGAKGGGPLEATFDHGDVDGFGLWLDPAVQDDPSYTEHWAGHRAVTVTIEADRIVIQRSAEEAPEE